MLGRSLKTVGVLQLKVAFALSLWWYEILALVYHFRHFKTSQVQLDPFSSWLSVSWLPTLAKPEWIRVRIKQSVLQRGLRLKTLEVRLGGMLVDITQLLRSSVDNLIPLESVVSVGCWLWLPRLLLTFASVAWVGMLRLLLGLRWVDWIVAASLTHWLQWWWCFLLTLFMSFWLSKVWAEHFHLRLNWIDLELLVCGVLIRISLFISTRIYSILSFLFHVGCLRSLIKLCFRLNHRVRQLTFAFWSEFTLWGLIELVLITTSSIWRLSCWIIISVLVLLETSPLIPDIAKTCFEPTTVYTVIHPWIRSMAFAVRLKLRTLSLLVILVQ